ncbi:MAG: hypothetical protein KatS3mg090_0512 [Patescibacteria group bacterium]|nr:MAG: hypothetical protein KatS3mg090_0512 [Patescibacteria group bacterium]
MRSKYYFKYFKTASVLALSLLITLFLSNFFIGDTPRLNKLSIKLMSLRTQNYLTNTFLSLKQTLNFNKVSDATTEFDKNFSPISWREPKPTTIPTSIPRPVKQGSVNNKTVSITSSIDADTSTVLPSNNHLDSQDNNSSMDQSNNNDNFQKSAEQTVKDASDTAIYECKTESNKSFTTLSTQFEADKIPLTGDLTKNPDVNLYLRGFEANNESKELINRSDVYGLDSVAPPQVSSVFKDRLPVIANTYHIFEWDFKTQRSLAPKTATPNFRVHMLGLRSVPGEKIYAPLTGRSIGENKSYLVLFADENNVLLTNSRANALNAGYLVYFLDICIYPNLVSLYRSADSAGRKTLPALSAGEDFAVARTNEVKIVIRDSMSFMDLRYKQDWWR